jgi:hypothetical protein
VRPAKYDASDPDTIGFTHIELSLQMIRRHAGSWPTPWARSPTVARLQAQLLLSNQAVDTLIAAGLAQGKQVIPYLAIPIDRTTFELGLFDVPEQRFIIDRTRTVGWLQPNLMAARLNIHHLTQTPHRMMPLLFTDKWVPHSDVLAKYAAAFLKISSS